MHKHFENKSALIFDGDDTLWETQLEYERAKEQFFQVMQQQGFEAKDVRPRFAQFDVANVERLGFSKERFPFSMQEVYLSFCREKHIDANPTIVNLVRDIGYSVFLRRPTLMKNAISILERLSQVYTLYLFTSGDLEVQQEKIRQLSISPLFRNVFITERKNADEFQKIIHLESIDVSKSWMIGNSLRSDINPAIQVGLRGIWVRSGSWEYDEALIPEQQVWVVESLDEITHILQGVDHLLLG